MFPSYCCHRTRHVFRGRRRKLSLVGCCFVLNSRATTSKMSSVGFLPSNQLHVASPDEWSRTIIVILGPPLFNCTISPSLNAGIGLLLCAYAQAHRPNYTQLRTKRVRKELHEFL